MAKTARQSNFKHLLLTISFSLTAVFAAQSAIAATLGKITMLSDLGKPLNAEIVLIPNDQDELASIKASIASKEVFAEQGVDHPDVLSDIAVTVGARPDGQPVLRLTSTQPISRPATDVLVQVDWAAGSLTRLYTLVLAPPTAESAAADVALPVEPAEATYPEMTTEDMMDEDVPDDIMSDEDMTAEVPLDEEELPSPDEAVPEASNDQEADDMTEYVPLPGEMGYMVSDEDEEPAPAVAESGVTPDVEEPVAELPPEAPTMEDIAPTEDVALNDDLTAEVPMEEMPADMPEAPTPVVGEPIKSEYAVAKGDTLRNIAVEMAQPDVSLERMMVGLHRANPDAFVNGDMNRLKKGQIMRAPTPEELNAIDQASAEMEVQTHVKNWNAYRNKVAGTVAKSTPAKDDNRPSSKVSGKITSVRDSSEASGPHDVVKLSSGAAGAGSKNGKLSKAEMQEALVARETALTESNARIALLEKQLQDAQKLLALHEQAAAQSTAATDAAKSGGIQTMMADLQKDPKAPIKIAAVVAVLLALWLLLRRKKAGPTKKADAPTSVVTESAAPASEAVVNVETVYPEVASEEVSAIDLVQEMQQAMQAVDTSESASMAEQEMVDAMQEAEPEAEPSWADAGLPLPEEEAEPEIEPSWADAGLPLPEEEPEPSWADAGLPLPEEEAVAAPMPEPAAAIEDEEPSWADAGLPLPEEETPPPAVSEAIAEDAADSDVLSMDDVEMLIPEEYEPTEIIEEPVAVVEPEPEPEVIAPEPEPEPKPKAKAKSKAKAKAEPAPPVAETSEEAFDLDDVFEGAALADVVADMPVETEADKAAGVMADEAAMDEMATAAMEEGSVEAEDQFALDDVFGEEAAQTTAPASDEALSMDDLADLLPVGDEEEAGAETAADDHSGALAAAFDESATKDLKDLDFGFDVDLGEVDETAPVTKAVPEPEKPAPTLDVKDIDLDVAGTGSTAAAVPGEAAEVDTMLDLATAYIDMSDEEGARELLKEILEKGGPDQQAKAQKMLDDLG